MARRVRLHPTCNASVYNSRVETFTQKVFEELAAKYRIYYAWGIGATGDHADGRAIDLMAYSRGRFSIDNPGAIRNGWNKTVADYIWDNRDRLGVHYIIRDQVIISTNPDGQSYDRWTRYNGESHANHVHVSFWPNAEPYTPPGTASEGEDDMPTPQDLWHHKTKNLNWKSHGEYEEVGEKTLERMIAENEAMVDHIASLINGVPNQLSFTNDKLREFDARLRAMQGTIDTLLEMISSQNDDINVDELKRQIQEMIDGIKVELNANLETTTTTTTTAAAKKSASKDK